jgi:hypothetical protein
MVILQRPVMQKPQSVLIHQPEVTEENNKMSHPQCMVPWHNSQTREAQVVKLKY